MLALCGRQHWPEHPTAPCSEDARSVHLERPASFSEMLPGRPGTHPSREAPRAPKALWNDFKCPFVCRQEVKLSKRKQEKQLCRVGNRGTSCPGLPRHLVVRIGWCSLGSWAERNSGPQVVSECYSYTRHRNSATGGHPALGNTRLSLPVSEVS